MFRLFVVVRKREGELVGYTGTRDDLEISKGVDGGFSDPRSNPTPRKSVDWVEKLLR